MGRIGAHRITIRTQSSALAGSAARSLGRRARVISSAPQVKQGSHTIVARCGCPTAGPTTTGSPIATGTDPCFPDTCRDKTLCAPTLRAVTSRFAEDISSKHTNTGWLFISYTEKYTHHILSIKCERRPTRHDPSSSRREHASTGRLGDCARVPHPLVCPLLVR